MIGSATANPKEKRKETHRRLKVANGFYFDISEELDSLNHIRPSGIEFFMSSFPHIDSIYNLGNSSKILFTYNHPKLIETGERMQELTGYSLKVLPLEEAIYAAIGFVEFEDKIILDRRAKKTKKELEKIGYKVITTPFGINKTNKQTGSLHCMATEIPIKLENLVMTDEKYPSGDVSIFFNLDGKSVLDESCFKLQLKN